MTNYEIKKAIFNEMVQNGYHMDDTRIEEICRDDFYTVKIIENWKKNFYKWLEKKLKKGVDKTSTP